MSCTYCNTTGSTFQVAPYLRNMLNNQTTSVLCDLVLLQKYLNVGTKSFCYLYTLEVLSFFCTECSNTYCISYCLKLQISNYMVIEEWVYWRFICWKRMVVDWPSLLTIKSLFRSAFTKILWETLRIWENYTFLSDKNSP